MRRLILFFFFVSAAFAAEDWGPLKFLVGNWIGEGTGKPGEATGGFSFLPDLQGAVLVRRNFAEYPAQAGKPASRHDDLMVAYREESSHQLRATYYDSEGHVISYAISQSDKGAIFTSEGRKEELRYRLTYAPAGADKLTIRFEIAPPGKAFATYIEATARRSVN